MSFNLNNLDSKELEKIQIMNSFAGMNPTGQLLFNNGIFKSQGNPAQIVTTASLQKKSLENTANNSYSSNSIQINENFENYIKKDFKYKINKKELILFICLLFLSIFIFFQK